MFEFWNFGFEPTKVGSTTSERLTGVCRSAKPMSACATQAFKAQSNPIVPKDKKSYHDGRTFLWYEVLSSEEGDSTTSERWTEERRCRKADVTKRRSQSSQSDQITKEHPCGAFLLFDFRALGSN